MVKPKLSKGLGKAADNHFIGAKKKIKYRGRHRLYLGIIEFLEA
jgi:hypothetical protein